MTAHDLIGAGCLVLAATVLCWPTARRAVIARQHPPGEAVRPALGVAVPVGSGRPERWWATSPGGPVVCRKGWVFGGVGGAGLLTGLLAGPVAGLVAGVYTGLGVRAWLRHRAARAGAHDDARTLDALCALAGDLRAGLPPTTLLASHAWSGDRLGRLTAAAGRLAEQTGAPLADLVERIEADARAMGRTRASAAAQAAGAQATAWLLAGLPLGGIALGYGIGADPLRVLLHTPIGAGCTIGALALQTAGLAWADRLSNGPQGDLR